MITHVWLANLDAAIFREFDFVSILSDNEKERASKFTLETLRNKFILAHGIVRTVLAEYCAVSPENLQFIINEYDKPFLLLGENQEMVHFNYSHSGDYLILAVNQSYEVGIDIEKHKLIKDLDLLAKTCFSESEFIHFSSLSNEVKQTIFFTYWTCKEAFIKAIGMGLSFPLKDFSIELSNGVPIKIINHKLLENNNLWSITQLRCPENYSAALVVNGKVGKINYFDFKDLKNLLL